MERSGAARVEGFAGIFARGSVRFGCHGSGLRGHKLGLDGECDGVVDLAAAEAADGFADLGVDLFDGLTKGAEAGRAVEQDVVGLEGHAGFEIDPERRRGTVGEE